MTQVHLPLGYPQRAEADVVLRDGSVAHLRPIKPTDIPAVHRFHEGQSDESIYLRFFAPLKRLSDKEVRRFTHLDYVDRFALVVTMGEGEREEIIGIGRYDRTKEHSAEVAFNISDAYHGKGIGSVLLEHLAAYAHEHDITRFEAEVLPHNRKMLAVFSDAGYAVDRHLEDGVVMLGFDIEPTEASRNVRLAREHRAEAVSVHAILNPTRVAVVGASRRERGIGHRVLANIVDGNFVGEVIPINPEGGLIHGLEAVPSLRDVPGKVDIAVVAVPAERVLDIVDDAAAANVHSLLIISSGFAEVGGIGEQLQRDLLRKARDHGMRIMGPNTFGVMNTALSLNATLSPIVPPPGHLGLFSQSGALAIATLDSAYRRNLGISTFVSAGNRVDVSGNDVMQYWIDDEQTKAVGLYLESMGNPRKFSRIARALAASKPVIVVKPGGSSFATPPGHRIRRGTTLGAHAFTSLLAQAGVVRAANVHELFDIAQLLLHQPRPAGNRVAIVTNSAQLGGLAANACAEANLEVSHGPVAVEAEAGATEFRRALDAAFDDPGVDSVIAAFIPPLVTLDQEVVEAVREASQGSDKTCVANLLGLRGVDTGSTKAILTRRASVLDTDTNEAGSGRAIPLYGMPEEAVTALAGATQYGMWRAKDHGQVVEPDGIDRPRAQAIVDNIFASDPDGRALIQEEIAQLLGAYGIDLWPRIEASNALEAVDAAEQVGYPVILKSLSPLVRGLGLLDAVRVDLASASAVTSAFQSLDKHLAARDANYLVVQKMAPSGTACVIGGVEDPLFGPVVSFSIAGPATELMDDIAHRLPPLTDVDIAEMVDEIKLAPLLNGHRGSPRADRDALRDLIARVSHLVDDLLEVKKIELNPVMVHPAGVSVLGARIELAHTDVRTDGERRTLG